MELRPFLGLVGIVLGSISTDFNSQVASIAMGNVSGGLGLSHDPGTWFSSLYLSAEVVGMALSPWLMVTFSLRQFTLFVFLLNAVSSGLIPFCPQTSALYLLRGLQGLSGGLTIPLLMTTTLRVLDPSTKLYGLAVYALTATFTPALSPAMAGLWTDLVGWRFVFLESLPLCAMAGLLVWYGEQQDSPDYGRFRIFDWRGALLVVVGLGSLTTMLQQGDRFDWFNSPFICMLALASLVAVPLLLVNEWFHPLPLLKLQLFGRRNLAYGGIAIFTFVIVGQSSSTVPDTFLQEVQGFRPEQFYLITFIIAGSQLVLLPATAWLLDHRRVDARVVQMVGLACVLISCIGASQLTTVWFRGQFYLWQAFQAVGQPLIVMPLLLLSTNSVKGPEEAPFISAAINTPRALAEATGVWLIQLIDRWRGGLHYNRLADQAGQDRWRLIEAPPIPPNPAPGSMANLQQMIEQQARVLTLSDTFLVMAALTVALMLVLLVMPQRTLPPRIIAAEKQGSAT